MDGIALQTRNTFVVQVRPGSPITVENALTREQVAVEGIEALTSQLRAWLGADCAPSAAAIAALETDLARARRDATPLELCHALLALGSGLRRAGRLEDARDALREAVTGAVEVGASSLEARARQELIAAGARPRRVAVSGCEALTPAERRVAEEVAEGRSNREAAELLFVSEKTVEGHLRAVFRKLHVESRTEIAAELRRDQTDQSSVNQGRTT